jgi:hypothetical protein
MPTSPLSPMRPLRPLLFMCLALLLTPGMATVASLCLLSQVELTTVFARLPGLSTSTEMIVAALLAVTTGMAVCLVITALSGKRPTPADMIAIELSQVLGLFLSIAALLHNPEEEFCKSSHAGSALAQAFRLESCNLTIDFWMQLGVGGLISASVLVLGLRMTRTAFRAASN